MKGEGTGVAHWQPEWLTLPFTVSEMLARQQRELKRWVNTKEGCFTGISR